MHATTVTNERGTVVTVCTNRFGGYTPVCHPQGTVAPKAPVSNVAFPTPDQAIAYARKKFGVRLVALADTLPAAPAPFSAA